MKIHPLRRTYINKEKLFFISDTHFYHANVMKYANRPFTDVNHMNEEMIKRWNEVVPKDGIVILCGDFGFASASKLKEIRDRLNGTIIFIAGNHDNENNIKYKGEYIFDEIHLMINIAVLDEDAKGGKQYITCCHYPMESYYNSRYGAWLVYGHHHGTYDKLYDVGVDNNDFYPVSYNKLKEIYNNSK